VLDRIKWTAETGLYLQGAVCGAVDGAVRLFISSFGRSDQDPAIIALNSHGTMFWKREFSRDQGAVSLSVQPAFVRPAGEPALICSIVGDGSVGTEGTLALLSARDGGTIWQHSTEGPFGSNRDALCLDLDADGEREILVGAHHFLVCLRADGSEKWRYDRGVMICWGSSAVGDVNGDGRMEIAIGSEYGNADGTSAMALLSDRGEEVWRHDGIEGDLGSNPAMLADANGNGRLEILKVELNLCARGPYPFSRLWCWSANGDALWRADFGGGEVSIADLDGDGALEAVGITNPRDGGQVSPAIICFDLRNGARRWERPVRRHWLQSWPAMARLDDSGQLRAIVGATNPSGYGRNEAEPPYTDLYVVDARGEVIWQQTFPDLVLCPIACDLDGDGKNELIVPCADGRIVCVATEGKADAPWEVAARGQSRCGAA